MVFLIADATLMEGSSVVDVIVTAEICEGIIELV